MPRRLAFSTLFVLSLALSSGLAHAAIELTATSSGTTLNNQIELLEDVGAQLTIRDMADPAVQRRFQPANGRASVGQSLNPWWIKVTLQRTADAPAQWWLEVSSVTQLDLRLYWPGPDGNWQERQSGERVAHREGRDHDFRHMLFRLPTLDQSPRPFTCAAMTRPATHFPCAPGNWTI